MAGIGRRAEQQEELATEPLLPWKYYRRHNASALRVPTMLTYVGERGCVFNGIGAVGARFGVVVGRVAGEFHKRRGNLGTSVRD